MKKLNKLENLIKTFFTGEIEKIEPTSEYTTILRSRLITLTAQQDKNAVHKWQPLIFFNYLQMKNKIFITLVLVLIFILTTAAILGFVNHRSRGKHAEVHLVTLSDKEQQSILAKVITTNAVSKMRSGASNSIGDEPGFFSGLNYSYVKSKINWGNSIGMCPEVNQTWTNSSMVVYSYDYREGDNVYSMYKNLVNGNLVVDYALEIRKAKSIETYEYKGGEYAVRKLETNVSSSYDGGPLDTTSLESLKTYFGDNVKLYKQEDGSEDYYLVESIYDKSCAGIQKSIKEYTYIDPNTFEVSKIEVYLGEKSELNLISRTAFDVENKNISLNEANSIFKFDLNVPVKNIKADYSAENELLSKEIVKEFFDRKNLSILVPTNIDVKKIYGSPAFLNAAMSVNMTKYLDDRKFYASGDIGDVIYNSRTLVNKNGSDYSISFSDEKKKKGVLINYIKYENEADLFVNINQDEKGTKSFITINGQKIDFYMTSKRKWPNHLDAYTYWGYFEYDNHYYYMFIDAWDANYDLTQLSFKELRTSDPSASKYISDMIAQTNK